jgi:predicted ribosomally synthesized peptide with nif11-like leader
MAENTADSASQLVDRLVNDAQFRESLEAAPTLHDKAQLIKAAGYGDVNVDDVRAALKEQLRDFGAGAQVDPERTKRVEELYHKLTTDKALQQALLAAATPEAARDVLAQAGYGDITLEDVRATAADLAQREELSDEELELVSGGLELSLSTDPEPSTASGKFAAEYVPAGMAMGAALGSIAGPVGTVVGTTVGMFVGLGTAIAQAAPPVSEW